MAVSVDLAKSLDKAYEDKSIKEILDASPAALAGVTAAQAPTLGEAARTWVVEERDWHKITSRVDGVYRGLLGQSSTEA